MKANEFVKKFGWEEAAEIVCGVPEKFRFKCLSNVCWDNNTYKYSDRFKPRLSLVNMADLKRLVESHELVKEHGSIVRAKMYAESIYTAPEVVDRLKQAIADVESCMEVSSESN